jgi:hypothetical protein
MFKSEEAYAAIVISAWGLGMGLNFYYNGIHSVEAMGIGALISMLLLASVGAELHKGSK